MINVIILGDLKRDVTEEMLSLIEESILGCSEMEVTLKSHPACPVNIDEVNIPNLKETSEPLSGILADFDLAIVSGSTSAAIDAYYAGIDMIVCLGWGELNLSPVRGLLGVTFARTSDEMQAALASIKHSKLRPQCDDFFWLDNTLLRWRWFIADSGYSQILPTY